MIGPIPGGSSQCYQPVTNSVGNPAKQGDDQNKEMAGAQIVEEPPEDLPEDMFTPQVGSPEDAPNPMMDMANLWQDKLVQPQDPQGKEAKEQGKPLAVEDEGVEQQVNGVLSGEEGNDAAEKMQEAGTKTEQTGDEELSDSEKEKVRELRSRDQEVHSHEQAHISAGGAHVRGGASYEYQTGPDGRRYAVGGEVTIDSGKGASPEDTVQKAKTVRAAALAPAKPSPQDRRVASKASVMENEARAEIAKEQAEEASKATEEQEKCRIDETKAQESAAESTAQEQAVPGTWNEAVAKTKFDNETVARPKRAEGIAESGISSIGIQDRAARAGQAYGQAASSATKPSVSSPFGPGVAEQSIDNNFGDVASTENSNTWQSQPRAGAGSQSSATLDSVM